jgi:3-hydroxyisobutyrate dehydrogenase-like beta-hydroxyacid dehydrogenase
MGGALAADVLKGGFPRNVHDLRRETAETLVSKSPLGPEPAALAQEIDAALLSLPLPADVEAVRTAENGVLAPIRPVAAPVSTCRPTRGLESGQGFEFLDAPVSIGSIDALDHDALTVSASGRSSHLPRP